MTDAFLRQLLLLIQPIGSVWAVLLVLTLVLWRKRLRKTSITAALLVLVITVFGSTDFPGWMLRQLEKPWVGCKPESLRAQDAIVVLGGGAEPSRYEAGQVHLTRAGDRLVMGMELIRLGKAKTIVLGGGVAFFGDETKVEADLVRSALLKWSPAAEIISLGTCEHTRDEAVKVAALVRERGWKSVAIVTSASHMTRALAVFHRAGIDATPAPCNFPTTLSTAPSAGRLQVPSWHGFEKVNIWLHEVAGWGIYRRRGWVE